MKDILEKLLDAADNHADDSGEPDHAVGDLQGLLRSAWAVMTIEQRRQLLKSDVIEQLVMDGARGEFGVDDLLNDVEGAVRDMACAISSAGYVLKTYRDDSFWQFGDISGEDLPSREEAIADAYRHLNSAKPSA